MNTLTEYINEGILDTTVDDVTSNTALSLLQEYGENFDMKIRRSVKPGYDIMGNKYKEGDYAILFRATQSNVYFELDTVVKDKKGNLMFVGYVYDWIKGGHTVRHTGPDWWARSIKIDDISKFMKTIK